MIFNSCIQKWLLLDTVRSFSVLRGRVADKQFISSGNLRSLQKSSVSWSRGQQVEQYLQDRCDWNMQEINSFIDAHWQKSWANTRSRFVSPHISTHCSWEESNKQLLVYGPFSCTSTQCLVRTEQRACLCHWKFCGQIILCICYYQSAVLSTRKGKLISVVSFSSAAPLYA